MNNTAAILKNLDKKAVLKYLLTEDKSTFEIKGVDTNVYTAKFRERNGYSLEQIEKSLTDQGITEVNEETVEKVLSLVEVSKNIDISSATQGIILALKMALNTLFCDSKYILNRFTGYFTDDPNNAEMVRLINTFNFQIKSVMDDLTFITFSNGQIASVPTSKTAVAVKKYYDDWGYYDDPNKLDSWDIREVNWINDDLQITIYLLDALIKIFPVNVEFESFKIILETALNVITEFNDSFKDIVILANSLDVIRVAPKTITPKADPIIFFNQITKQRVLKENNHHKVQVLKTTLEGRVTGIVYEPDTPDSDGNWAGKPVIAKAQHGFMVDYQQFDIDHNGKILKSEKGEGRQVALIQSFIAPQDLTYGDRIVKAGAWIAEVQYYDPEILDLIAKGEFTGFSLEGVADIAPIPVAA
jgi:hypothetical protein